MLYRKIQAYLCLVTGAARLDTGAAFLDTDAACLDACTAGLSLHKYLNLI